MNIKIFIILFFIVSWNYSFGQINMTKKVEHFTSLKEARTTYKKYQNNNEVVKIDSPLWGKFEGTFSIKYACLSKHNPCYANVKRAEKKISKEIKQAYPDEPFKVEGMFGSKDSLEIEITCNKTLKDKFNLYPIACCDWTYFKLELTSFWK